jgi:hypothetical protein
MVQPQFVSSVARNGTAGWRSFPPVVLNPRICSGRHAFAKLRRKCWRAWWIRARQRQPQAARTSSIAGKTGTAQIASDKAGYKVNGVSYQASFVGYFPADAPKYTCIVVVSSPSQRGVYGNVVAGPVFFNIAEKIYGNRLELQTTLAAADSLRRTPVTFSGDRTDLITAMRALHVPMAVSGEGPWATTTAGDSVVALAPRNLPELNAGLIPDVQGMGLRDALYILENRGLRVRPVGSGMVRKQWPAPGTRAVKGTTHHDGAGHMILLKDLIYKDQSWRRCIGDTNAAVEHVAFDSRAVTAFTAFVAVRGAAGDGHGFIDMAVEQGANGRGLRSAAPRELREPGVAYVRVADSAVGAWRSWPATSTGTPTGN